MAIDTDSYIDAKAAEVHAKARADLAAALIKVVESQRESDRAAFRLGMWMTSVVIAAAAAVVGVILAVLG
ncbi:MAG: hypothetical protein OXF41_07640 [bacterium]|nr:hypothetical protein [bacterium]